MAKTLSDALGEESLGGWAPKGKQRPRDGQAFQFRLFSLDQFPHQKILTQNFLRLKILTQNVLRLNILTQNILRLKNNDSEFSPPKT